MYSRKKISIIMPIYNSSSYLRRSVDSVLNQTHKNLEIILIDDGSTDDSGRLCDEYSASDARVITIHQENAGPGAARNRGLDIASGDYISFVDSDDYIEPEMYASMISLAEDYQADIAICNLRDALDTSKLSPVDCIVYDRYEALKQRLKTHAISDALWDKIYSSILWKDIRFPTDRFLAEDSACIYKTLSNSRKVVCTNRVFYHVTVREESLSHRGYSPNFRFTISTYEEMAAFFKATAEEEFATIAENAAVGAVFFNVIGFNKSKSKDRITLRFIKSHAKKQFKEYKTISKKKRIALFVIAYLFCLTGLLRFIH